MLLTHPLPESRITDARNRAAQYPHRYIPDQLNYQLAKARIQVRFSSYSDQAAISLFDKQLKKKTYTFENAALYGKALALFRVKKFEEAEEIIDGLLENDRNNLFYLDTKTDLLAQKDDYETAIELLKHHHRLKPTSLVIAANLANIYVEADQPRKAIPLLEDLIFLDRQNVLPYQIMTQAYRKLGNKALEHYSNAEAMALAANYDGAIDQLNYAYRHSEGQTLQIARIEAMNSSILDNLSAL